MPKGKAVLCPPGFLQDPNHPRAVASIARLGNYVRDHLLDPMVATFLSRRGGIGMQESMEKGAMGVTGGLRGLDRFKAFLDGEGKGLLDETYNSLITDDSLLREIVRRAILPHTPEGRDALRLASGDAARTYRYAGAPEPHRVPKIWAYDQHQGVFPEGAYPKDLDLANDRELREAWGAFDIDLAPADLHRVLGEEDVWRTQLTYEHKRQILDTLVGGQFKLPHEDAIVRYLKVKLTDSPRKLVEAQWDKLAKADTAKKKFARRTAKQTGLVEGLDPALGPDRRLQHIEALNMARRRALGFDTEEGRHQVVRDLVEAYGVDDIASGGRRLGAMGWKQALYESAEGMDPELLTTAGEVGKRLQEYGVQHTRVIEVLDDSGKLTAKGLHELLDSHPELAADPNGLLRDLLRDQPIDPKVMATLYNHTLQKAQQVYPSEQGLQDFLMVALMRATGVEPRQLALLKVRHVSPDGVMLIPGRAKGGAAKGGIPRSAMAREVAVGNDVTATIARLLAHRQTSKMPGWETLVDDLPLFRAEKRGVWEAIPEGKAGQVFGGWRARMAGEIGVEKSVLGDKNFRRYAVNRADTALQASRILGHATEHTTAKWYWKTGGMDPSDVREGGFLSRHDYSPGRLTEAEAVAEGGRIPLERIAPVLRNAADAYLEALAASGTGMGRQAMQARTQAEVARFALPAERLKRDLGMPFDPNITDEMLEGVPPLVDFQVPPTSLSRSDMGVGRRTVAQGEPHGSFRLMPMGEAPLTQRGPGGIEVTRAPQTPFGARMEQAAATPGTARLPPDPKNRQLDPVTSRMAGVRFAGEPVELRLRQTARDRAVAKGILDPNEARHVERLTPESDPRAWQAIEDEMDILIKQEGFTLEGGRARVLPDGTRVTLGSTEGFEVAFDFAAAPGVRMQTVERLPGAQVSPGEAVVWADPVEAEGYFKFFADGLADSDPAMVRRAADRINAGFQEALEKGYITDPMIFERFWGPEGAFIRDPILFRYVQGAEAHEVAQVFMNQNKALMDFLEAAAPKRATWGKKDRAAIKRAIMGETAEAYKERGLGLRFSPFTTEQARKKGTGQLVGHKLSQGFNAAAGELRQEAIREVEDLVRILSGHIPTVTDPTVRTRHMVVKPGQVRDPNLSSPALFDALGAVGEHRYFLDKSKSRDNLSAVLNFFSMLTPIVALPALAAGSLGVGDT